MPKTIKYNGAQDRWSELATTGKQSTWRLGQQEQRSDAEAGLLLGTGFFSEVVTYRDIPAEQVKALVSGYGIPRIIYQNNAITQSSDTGVATANALASFVLPGGSMGPNGWLRFTMIMKGIDAINAAKNTRLWANSTRIFENGTTTTAGVVQYQFNWFNSNAENAQTSFYRDQLAYGTTGATAGSSAINTAQDITFYLTGDSASATGPTIQKCAFMVELLRGA